MMNTMIFLHFSVTIIEDFYTNKVKCLDKKSEKSHHTCLRFHKKTDFIKFSKKTVCSKVYSIFDRIDKFHFLSPFFRRKVYSSVGLILSNSLSFYCSKVEIKNFGDPVHRGGGSEFYLYIYIYI